MREQSYLASRMTNIVGSQFYEMGSYAAMMGIPGGGQFMGQEASIVRGAGALGTAGTMLGMNAMPLVPILMGVAAGLGRDNGCWYCDVQGYRRGAHRSVQTRYRT